MRAVPHHVLAGVALFALAACGRIGFAPADAETIQAGVEDTGPELTEAEFCAMRDAGAGVDSGAPALDAGFDAGFDAGAVGPDSGGVDGGGVDGGGVDGGGGDGGLDGAPPDAGAADAGGAGDAGDAGGAGDAGASDASGVDASVPAPLRPGLPGLVALYDFEQGTVDTVADISGVAPALNLTVRDVDAVRLVDGGLAVESSTLIHSEGPAQKIYDACTATNEVSIEAWVRIGDIELDGPARIVTYSTDTSLRNFTLGQEGSAAVTRLRSTATDDNGLDPTTESDRCILLGNEIRHLVFTRSAADGVTHLYLDGEDVGSEIVGSSFSNWDRTMAFGLANELTADRTWLGEYHLVAIYSRAITIAEVESLYAAGPGAL